METEKKKYKRHYPHCRLCDKELGRSDAVFCRHCYDTNPDLLKIRSERMSGNNNPTKNPVIAKKISDAKKNKSYTEKQIGKCGFQKENKLSSFKRSEETIKKIKHKKTSEHCIAISMARLGIKNTKDWFGFVTPIYQQLRNCMKYQEWRQQIFVRDHFTCQNRNCNKTNKRLHAHHIKHLSELLKEVWFYLPLMADEDLFKACLVYDPMWDIKNGITLCEKCHKIEHSKESGQASRPNVCGDSQKGSPTQPLFVNN
jgi:5-methylcytosine-specific restriction endonuclease McrA